MSGNLSDMHRRTPRAMREARCGDSNDGAAGARVHAADVGGGLGHDLCSARAVYVNACLINCRIFIHFLVRLAFSPREGLRTGQS